MTRTVESVSTLPSFGSGPPATAATADTNLSTEVAVTDGGGKASPSVSIFTLSVLILVVTAEASLAISRQSMTITCASIVSRGYYSLREFRSGRCRSCLFAIYGATSVPLNGAALGALISITYAWSVKDEELSSSPPRGARIHGLPVRADLSLEASCRPIHTDCLCKEVWVSPVDVFFLLYAAWVRSRAERPSVSYTKVVMEVAWTGHNLQFTKTN